VWAGTELMPPRLRSLGFFSVILGFAIGNLIFPILAYCIRDWRWFLGVTGGIGVIYIPYCWYEN